MLRIWSKELNKLYRKSLFVLSISILFVIPNLTNSNKLFAVPLTDGSGDWRTLETKNFSIHFPRVMRSYAKNAAKIFEATHLELAKHYVSAWVKYKTDVVLVFSSDISQGFATTLGINQIVLYLESPVVGEFSRYNDWLKLLFTHEYVHILSLKIWDPSRMALFLERLVLGIPPNIIGPNAFSEGVAVWEESQSGLGRLEDPLTQMIVRTAIKTKVYPSLKRILNPSNDWPGGVVPYLYGGRFMAELSRQGKFSAPRDYWAKNILSLRIASRISRLKTPSGDKLSLRNVYQGMRKRDFSYFETQIKGLEQKGLSPYTRITKDGEHKRFLIYTDKNELVYFSSPVDAISGVHRIKLDAKKLAPTRLRRQVINRGIAWGENKRFYSSDQFIYPSFGFNTELHDGNKAYLFSRLAKGRTISYPSLGPDAKIIYFIERQNDKRLLKMAPIQEKTGKIDFSLEKVLLKTGYSGILQYTSVSQDGNYLSTLYRSGTNGFGKLSLCKLTGPGPISCKIVLQTNAIITQACFSKDNKEIFFSSDVDGIYNLYAFNLANKKVMRLTRTTGGIFYPAAAKDAIYAIAYFKDGYDLVRFDNNKLLREEVNFFKNQQINIARAENETQKYSGESEKEDNLKESDYGSLLLWKPYYSGLLGLGTFASSNSYFYGGIEARDPLHWHIIGATLGLLINDSPTQEEAIESQSSNQELQSIPASFYYIYNRYKMGFLLNYLRGDVFNKIKQVFISYIDSNRYLSFQGLVGYKQEDYFNITDLEVPDNINSINTTPSHYKLYREIILEGPSFSFLLGDTNFFRNSISIEQGFILAFKRTNYLADASHQKITYMDDVLEDNLEYSLSEGGIFLFLPSFFSNHVNYFSAYGYKYSGKDVDRRVHNYNNLVRNLDPNIFHGSSYLSYSYEYRFPVNISWDMNFLEGCCPYLDLYSFSLAPFYDHGIIKDTERDYETWAYGLKINVILNLFYNTIPELSFVIGKGKEGDNMYGFSFSANGYLGLQSVKNENFRRNSDSITRPIRPNPLYHSKAPGYFHR